MNTQKLEQNIRDFMSGFIRNRPDNLALLREYADWQRMAKLEFERRTARFLDCLPDEALRAIATGEIDLNALARGLDT